MLRVSDQPEKYLYVIPSNQKWLIRVFSFIGLISIFSLGYGFYHFLIVSWVIFGVLIVPFTVILLYYGINYFIQLFYPGFDLGRHRKFINQYWSTRKANPPKVAVLIPVSGEPEKWVQKTVNAAMKIDYKNKDVYLLDDTEDGIYKKIAKQAKCNYFNRPNVGEGRKSGNLNYALKKIRKVDSVLVLDADVIARKEILKEMVPYMRDDVALVQSPQHFNVTDSVFKRSLIEYAAGLVQRDFYRVNQVTRDRFDSAICVGTNALYNYKPLQIAGGFVESEYAEDVHTGLNIINEVQLNSEPYRVKYIPIQLAVGLCPDNYYSMFKQQNRWCTGSFKLVFSRKTLFSKVLKPSQKLIYFSNCLYYLYTLSILLVPLQLLALNLIQHGNFQWKYTYYFLPQIIMTLIVFPYIYRRVHVKHRFSIMVLTVSHAYTFLQAMFYTTIRKTAHWEATAVKKESSQNYKRFNQLKAFCVMYLLVFYLGTLCIAILNEDFGRRTSYLLQILFIYAFIAQLIHMVYLFAIVDEGNKKLNISVIASVLIIIVAGLSFATAEKDKYHLYALHPNGIRLVKVSDNGENATSSGHDIKSTKANNNSQPSQTAKQQHWTDFVYMVKPNQNMSGLISGTLSQEFKTTVSPAQLGYMQNYLMNVYGYQELSAGQTFVVRQTDIQAALKASSNAANDPVFWSSYASQAGL